MNGFLGDGISGGLRSLAGQVLELGFGIVAILLGIGILIGVFSPEDGRAFQDWWLGNLTNSVSGQANNLAGHLAGIIVPLALAGMGIGGLFALKAAGHFFHDREAGKYHLWNFAIAMALMGLIAVGAVGAYQHWMLDRAAPRVVQVGSR